MKNLICFVVFLGIFLVAGCDRINPVQSDAGWGGIPRVSPVIERSHIYESDRLTVSLSPEIATVKLVASIADEMGNPEVVLLTVQNPSDIERDPSWFENDVERFFLIPDDPADRRGGLFYDFYWVSPSYSLEDHISAFQDLPAPIIFGAGSDLSVTGTLRIYFKTSREAMRFPGLRHRTRIHSADRTDAYTQWAVWSTLSSAVDDVWSVTFGDHAPGNSSIDISRVILTEHGDYEIPGEGIDVPYGFIGRPYNLIEVIE